MRFLVELTDGVTSKVNLSGKLGSAPTSYWQPLTQVKDLLQATQMDVGIVIYAMTTNANSANSPRLYLESSMQNEDESASLWPPMQLGENEYINLVGPNPVPLPGQLIKTVTRDFGRYVRWRIEIPGASPEITLTLIFKVTLLGHG